MRPPGEKGESLEMTIQRVMPYYEKHIVADLLAGRNVLVVAHGNSLRSLLFKLDRHTKETIMDVNIPTGVPIIYELEQRDGELHASKHHSNTRAAHARHAAATNECAIDSVACCNVG